jgi:hypothetical protein
VRPSINTAAEATINNDTNCCQSMWEDNLKISLRNK